MKSERPRKGVEARCVDRVHELEGKHARGEESIL